MKLINCDICGKEIFKKDANEAKHNFKHQKLNKKFFVKSFFCEDCINEAIENPSVMYESEAFQLRAQEKLTKIERVEETK